MNLIDRRSLMREVTFRGVDTFGTRAMIIELALLAVKYFLVAIALFLLLPGKLVAETLLNIVDLVQSIGVWFLKKQRKPPDKNKSKTQQIILIVALILLWPSICGKRGRISPRDSQRPAAAAIRDRAPDHFFPIGNASGQHLWKHPRPALIDGNTRGLRSLQRPTTSAHSSARGQLSLTATPAACAHCSGPRPALAAAPAASALGSTRGQRSRQRPWPTLTAAPAASAHGSARGQRSW